MTPRRFQSIYDELFLPLSMYALHIVGDVDDARDIVQDVFIKAWQRTLDGYEIDNAKPYLYRMVRNACISELRSRREQIPIDDEISNVNETDIDTSERDAAVWRAIDSLPQKCREVFLLSKRDGLSNDEIAARLHISGKTVSNHLHKAGTRLRALLANHRPAFLPFL